MKHKIQAFLICLPIMAGVIAFVLAPVSAWGVTLAPGEAGQSQPDAIFVPNQALTPDTYYRAKVLKILEEGLTDVDGAVQYHQKLELEIENGNEKGKKIIIDHGGLFAIEQYQTVKPGDKVVITKPANSPKADFYYIVDKYRVPGVTVVILIFFVLALYFGRRRGLTSLLGLVFTVLVLFYGVIPRIIKGGDPLTVSIIAALVILLVSLYLSHGFNKRTTIAVVSSFGALGFALLIDLLFVYLAGLVGNGTEEAFFLQFDNKSVNLKGILLGGILIGVLGVLDDVTTSQTAALEEISKANPAYTARQLYQSGLSIGREHIASLINTLVLAYAGASFPLLILFASQRTAPLWMALNSSFIAEEIVRTLVGSSALIIAVPLTTVLGAYWYGKKRH